MNVIIQPGQGQSLRDLLTDVKDVVDGPVRTGFGGVVLSSVQAHTYLVALHDSPAGYSPPTAKPRPAKKAAAAKKTTAAAARRSTA